MDIGEQNGVVRTALESGNGGAKKLFRFLAVCVLGLAGLAVCTAQAPNSWRQPTTELAGKIADLLGPGQANLTLSNLSSIPNDQVSEIRELLVQALRARGVTAAGPDSANSVRVTLSESAKERLWVAQVIEGNQTKVAMVDAGPASAPRVHAAAGLMLRRKRVFAGHTPILASLETAGGLVILQPQRIAIYSQTAAGWHEQQHADIAPAGPLPRDPRGILLPPSTGHGFVAWLPGTRCTGSFLASAAARYWAIGCHKSDDPWVISSGTRSALSGPGTVAPALPAQLPNGQSNPVASAQSSLPTLKAFYDASRDYFTGVVVPSPRVDLPPFYSAAFVPRPAGGDALLIGGIDGKVQLLANGSLSPVDGVRDWGSDFAALHSGCGTGTQIIVSASGEAVSDSLRAYELPALEAIPASEPLAMNGTVTALWTAPDGRGVMAVVRSAPNQYEVDRVTASCN